MPANPIEEFSVAINADTDDFIKDVQDAFKEVEQVAGKSANQIEGAFIEAMADTFKSELLPEIEENFKRVGQLMQNLDISLEEAVTRNLAMLEESGEGFGMTVDQMLQKAAELRQGLDVEISSAVDTAVLKLELMGKKLSPEMVLKLRATAEQIRLTSSSVEEFEARMDKLIDSMKGHTKATRKSTSSLKRWANQLFVALGLTLLAQKAWRAFTSFIKQSADDFIKAADAQSEVVRAFKRTEIAMQSASESTGAATIIFVNFFKKIELAAKQLVVIFITQIPKIIDALAPVVAGYAAWFALIETGIHNLKALFRGDFSDMRNGLQAFADAYVETFEKMTGVADNLEEEFRGNLAALGTEAERSARRLLAVMEKLEEEMKKRLDRISQRLQDRIDDLNIDLARDIEDAYRDLNADLAEIDEDARADAFEAQQDYNQTLLELEEDHKLAMIRLEEDFLFNIEDAVRQRDARGVLMAQRQFNKAKKDLERQKNLRAKRLRDDFRVELAEIERERQIRREERLREMEDELADLQRQYDRRRSDLELDRERSLRDLEKYKNDELKRISTAESEKLQLQAAGLQALHDMLNAAFGQEGWALAFISNYLSAWESITGPSGSPQDPFRIGPRRQRGGTTFATSPMLLPVGEIPERIDITPLSQSTGQPRAGFGGGGGGATDINLEVMLEDGLEAHLVDQTMEGVANVLLNISKKARK